MRFLFDLAYLTALAVFGPLVMVSRWRKRKSLGNLREKLWGNLPLSLSGKPRIWLHAVSVGEVLQIQPVVRQLQERFPLHELLISTTTTTGHKVAVQKYGEHCTVCYFPLDFSWSVRRALDRVRTDLIVLVELELWPNFIREADRANIPITLINGRITERSWNRYRWIKPLMKSLLCRLRSIQVQDPLYAQRMIDLGAPRDRVTVTGSIKFDGVRCERNHAAVQEIRSSFGIQPNDLVFIAGSTQAPEEQLAVTAYQQLKTEFPNMRLMLVPRHPERFEEVANLVVQSGLPLIRRSLLRQTDQPQPSVPPDSVLLLDTLGELSAAWGLAEVAFVGGSLSQRGGQNMIEPAGYGACLLFGPNTWNFRDAVHLLLESSAALEIPAPSSFTPYLRRCLKDRNFAISMGLRAQQVVRSQQGATSRTVDQISQILSDQILTGEQKGQAAA